MLKTMLLLMCIIALVGVASADTDCYSYAMKSYEEEWYWDGLVVTSHSPTFRYQHNTLWVYKFNEERTAIYLHGMTQDETGDYVVTDMVVNNWYNQDDNMYFHFYSDDDYIARYYKFLQDNSLQIAGIPRDARIEIGHWRSA